MNAPNTGADVPLPAAARVGHDPPGQTRLRQLAEEQAALRRVATLVAGGAQPTEVFTAVANGQNRAALEASRDELARLLEEQAALRRVATLVARGIDPVEIFSAVAEEICRLLDADNAGISRFEPDGTSVVVSRGVGEGPVKLPIGTRLELRDYLAPAMVWRTGRSARVDEDTWSSVSDPAADRLRELGIRSMGPARSSSKAACGAWWPR